MDQNLTCIDRNFQMMIDNFRIQESHIRQLQYDLRIKDKYRKYDVN